MADTWLHQLPESVRPSVRPGSLLCLPCSSSGTCRCLGAAGWWKLAPGSESPAGAGRGLDIVPALGVEPPPVRGLSSATRAALPLPPHPLHEKKKTICLSRCAVRLHIAGPRCSPRTRDPSRCRWQQIKIAVNHRRAHNTSINAPADKGFAGSQGPRLNGTAEEILFQWLSTHGSGAGAPESRRRK